MNDKDKDLRRFKNVGEMPGPDGIRYEIWVRRDTAADRVEQITGQLKTRTLEISGHVYVPEWRKRHYLPPLQTMVEFLQGKTRSKRRQMILPGKSGA